MDHNPHAQVHGETAYIAADTADITDGMTNNAAQASNGVEVVPHLGGIQDGMLPEGMQGMPDSYEAYQEDPMRLINVPATQDAQVSYYDHSGANVGLMPGSVNGEGVYVPDVADLQAQGQVSGVDGQGIGVGVGLQAPLDPQHPNLGQASGLGGDDEYKEAQPQQFYKKRQKLVMACHFCRRRKLKCNGVRPQCGNCVKRAEVCLWDDAVRRRGPGRRTKGLHPEHYDADGQLLPEYMSRAQRRTAGLDTDDTDPLGNAGGVGGEGEEGAQVHEYGQVEGHEEQLAHAAEHGHEQTGEHEHVLGHEHEHGHLHGHGHHESHGHEHDDQDDAHSALADPPHASVSDTNAALIAAVAAAARDTQGLDGVGMGVGVGVGNGLDGGLGGVEGEGYEDLSMGMIDPALAEGGMAAGEYDPQTHGHTHGHEHLHGEHEHSDASAIDDPAEVDGLGMDAQDGHGIGVGIGVGYGVGAAQDGQTHGEHDAQHVQAGGETYEAYAEGEEAEEEDPFAAFMG